MRRQISSKVIILLLIGSLLLTSINITYSPSIVTSTHTVSIAESSEIYMAKINSKDAIIPSAKSVQVTDIAEKAIKDPEDAVPPVISNYGPETLSIWKGAKEGANENVTFTRTTPVALVGFDFNISAIITDEDSGVKNATVEYAIYDGTQLIESGSKSMINTGENKYTALIGTYSETYTVKYNITAYDNANNMQKVSGTFTIVEDDTPPTIYLENYVVGSFDPSKSCLLLNGNETDAMYYETENWMSIIVNDTLTVDDEQVLGSGVEAVILVWRIGATKNEKLMYTNSTGFAQYRFFAPITGEYPYGSKIEFWFEAIDAAGNKAESHHFVLLVKGDDVPPIIRHYEIQPEEPKPGEEVTVIVWARDKDEPYDSYLTRAVLKYSTDGGKTWETVEMILQSAVVTEPGLEDTHKYMLHLPGQPAGTNVSIIITVYDNAGNYASVETYYIVKKPLPVSTTIVIAAVAVVIIVVVAAVFLKKLYKK